MNSAAVPSMWRFLFVEACCCLPSKIYARNQLTIILDLEYLVVFLSQGLSLVCTVFHLLCMYAMCLT